MGVKLNLEVLKRAEAINIANEMRADHALPLDNPDEGKLGSFAQDDPAAHAAMRTRQPPEGAEADSDAEE